MTTPEKLRQRQRREFMGILVLGVLTVLLGVWNGMEDRAQDRCISDSFEDLTAALTARADIVDEQRALDVREERLDDREQAADKALILPFAMGEIETEADFAPIRKAYQTTVVEVEKERAVLAVQQEALDLKREATDYPPYPEGKCE